MRIVMNINFLGDFAIIGISLAFTFLIIVQSKKLWKIKSNLEVFLFDIIKLNENIQKIIDASKGKSIDIGELDGREKRTCENCKNRVTYIDFSYNDFFQYKCKLNNKDIELNYICKSYQKDLQNSKI